MDLVEKDRALIWHPCTQEMTTPPPMLITGGKGSYLMDANGRSYLDLISSWWVNLYGHAHPRITRAIHEQCQKLEHVIFARFTHEPAVQFCEQLHSLLPASLSKFFYSDNGSTSVEVALKMAYKYWLNKGREKRNFLSFEGSYHGDTFGCMSVGMVPRFHTPFRELCFDVRFIPFADTWSGDANVEEKERQALDVMRRHMDELGDTIAAIIVEPLIQCAAAMMMCRPEFMRAVCHLAADRGIFVIFDEVAVGFGRTGTNFAFEQIDGVVPDFLCLSKGITGGFLPLAVTVTTRTVYEAFLGDTAEHGFMHGHSYTGNPIGCAAALASFELLVAEETRRSLRTINEVHRECVHNLQKMWPAQVQRSRVLGTIAAFDLTLADLEPFVRYCMDNGIILRPLSNTVYLMPPYCITEDELRGAYAVISAAIRTLAVENSSDGCRRSKGKNVA